MKIATIFLVLALATSTLAGDCNNPLKDAFNITGYLSSPITVSDLTYCKNLQDGTARSCCSVDFISQVQTKQDGFKEQMQSMAGNRDKYIKQCKEGLQTLKQTAENFTSVRDGVSNETLKSLINQKVAPIQQFVSQVTGNATELAGQFKDYQKARATCFKKMLELQGAAVCLACDANWADRGVSPDGNVTMSNETCTEVITACYPYLIASVKQSQFVQIGKAGDLLQGYSNMTADLTNQTRPQNKPPRQQGGQQGPQQGGQQGPPPSSRRFLEGEAGQQGQQPPPPPNNYGNQPRQSDGLPEVGRTSTPSDNSQRPIRMPPGCEDERNPANCTWICHEAFKNGKVKPDLIGAGGQPKTDETQLRRILTTSTSWTVAAGEAGTNSEVSSDPAGISLTSGSLNLIVKTFALLVVLALYIAF